MTPVKELNWWDRSGLVYDIGNVQSAASRLLPAALKAEDTILHGERYEGELMDQLEETALRISNILYAWRDMQKNISGFPEIYAIKELNEKCERAMKAVELRRNWTQEAPMYGQDIEGS